MRFLLDQDIWAITERFRSDRGHDVVPVAQVGLAQADDEQLLQTAVEQGRLFLTRDRDFGSMVFVKGVGPGVLYLRILPSMQNAVHAELERVLNTYSEKELMLAEAFLDKFLISDANIEGIGRGRLALLRAEQVVTAADIKPSLKVPGFGPTFWDGSKDGATNLNVDSCSIRDETSIEALSPKLNMLIPPKFNVCVLFSSKYPANCATSGRNGSQNERSFA